jgi:hypothetical protein
MLSDSENSPGQINILNIKSRLMNLECSSADFFTFPERQFKLEIGSSVICFMNTSKGVW